MPRIAWTLSCVACAGLSTAVLAAGPQNAPRSPAKPTQVARTAAVKTFASPQLAADALIDAADRFDLQLLEQLFGASGKDLLITGEPQDRERAREFVDQARAKQSVSVDPTNKNRAFLLVGAGDWPFPIPIVKRGAAWSFDAAAGRQELLYRRIGANELDAIEICRGYVEAQHEYALQKREGYGVNQYAQRLIATPGNQDGLAWQNADGTWDGPVGINVAHAIAQGYSGSRTEPFHGYFFKILKGQGPAAPLGQMDFVVKGLMIGGFALVAAPAEYGVTGVQTFIVSHDGVVYQKDLGKATLDAFAKMDRFNPDKSWTPVMED
jgi:hypothetical protein